VSIEDVSFLFATNRDLDALYREGKFRGDLLDRIRSGKTIHLPPLRDRREDFPLLVEALLRKAEEEFNAKKRSVLEEAMDALKNHSWPGNVRELDSCIRRAVADYPRIDRLAAIHLRIHVAQSIPTHPTRFDDLVQELERLGGDSLSPEDLKGALAKLENAYAMASARLIKAGLDCTRNSTGEIQITPAMRLVMNQGDLTTAQAADLIKRFLRPLDASRLPDETLERARQAANRLRTPKKSKGVPDTSASPASHAVPPPGPGKMS
jgi:DNA-binding NtrC family response regulator